MILLLSSLGLYLASGLLALAVSSRPKAALRIGAGGALAAGACGLVPALGALTGGSSPSLSLPWAVPGGAFSLGLDPLSAAFLVPVLALSALFSVYGAGYLSAYAGKKPLGSHVAFYNLLAASMVLVLTARDGLLFLVAWETMSLSSFFLVAFEDEKADVRAASRLYLIAMHLGAAFLLGFFALGAREAGSFGFAAFSSHRFSPGPAAALFALAVVGFGTKAGLWPLHVWLPKAHPAAPSHVSALMSGVMVKTGIYGLCRVLLLLGAPRASWGVALLLIGAVSGIFGLLNALSQRDLKALLAYSTGENVGIVTLGLGVGVLGAALGRPGVAAVGFAGALLHVWNHGLFKGLLFLASGSVLHATHSRQLERLGGLWKKMPLTGAAFLVGALAISALPPFNGLASEWLLYSGFFRAGVELPGLYGLASLTAAAALALIGGLALACFTRAFGVVFLGAPRAKAGAAARDPGPAMLLPMGVLAALCLGLGLFPSAAAALLAPTVLALAPGAANLPTAWAGHLSDVGWVSLGLLALVLLLLGVRRALLSGRVLATAPTWDCGFAEPTARMQYTGASFAEPLTTLFREVLRSRGRLIPPRGYFPATGKGRFASRPSDGAERALWRPVFRAFGRLFEQLRFLQQGRVQIYLLYVFATVVGLLVWALAL